MSDQNKSKAPEKKGLPSEATRKTPVKSAAGKAAPAKAAAKIPAKASGAPKKPSGAAQKTPAGKKKSAASASKTSATGSAAKSRAQAAKKNPRKSAKAAPALSAVAFREHGSMGASRVRPVSPANQRAKAEEKKRPAAKRPAASPKAVSPAAPNPKRPMSRAEARRLAKRKKDRRIVAILAVMVALVLGLFARQFAAYQNFDKMRQAVEVSTFYQGTYVDGINVSGLTLEAAQSRWADEIEPSYSGRTVTFSEGGSVTAEELGYASDFMETLDRAWNSARSGSLEERYREVSRRAQTPENFSVTRKLYDSNALDAFVAELSLEIETPVKEAGINGFDEENYTFVYTEGSVGRAVDAEQIARDAASAMEAGGGNVVIQVSETHPTTHLEDVKDEYGLIAYAKTDASSSKASRLSNIKLAMDTINGYCLEPGETFSFNEVVGERTEARGYQEAAAYSGGSVVQQVGGGICQVSSTLFNAAVKANLEIVERYEHSMEVSYVNRGKDATVDWGNKDLKFKNTSDEPVYIGCLLDGSKNVRIGVYGRQLPDGMYITLDTSTVSRTAYETQYEYNASLPPGARKVTRSGKYSYTTDTYKIIWSESGKELKKTYMFRSRYAGRSEIVEYG